MDKIGLIIEKRMNQHKLGESARAGQIILQANKLLHQKLECEDAEVRAFRFKEGVLYVGTVGSAWSQEVFHQQANLMKEIRAKHGQKSISKIVIKSLTTN